MSFVFLTYVQSKFYCSVSRGAFILKYFWQLYIARYLIWNIIQNLNTHVRIVWHLEILIFYIFRIQFWNGWFLWRENKSERGFWFESHLRIINLPMAWDKCINDSTRAARPRYSVRRSEYWKMSNLFV